MIEKTSEKKKDTVRIGKKDLMKLLSDNEHMLKQITELQARLNELLEEVRELKKENPVKAASGKPVVNQKEVDEEPFLDFSKADIYFDGSNGFGSK